MHLVTINGDDALQAAPWTAAIPTWPSREAHPSWPGWKWHALHDPLTGLANRRFADERMRESLRRAARTRSPVTVLFVDLDRFREINRSRGHCGGDHVLCVVASRLVNEARCSDTVARLAGDEFVVVMEDAPGRLACAAAERMRQAVAEPISVPAPLPSSEPVTVTASIGLARARVGLPQELLHRSDLAMYAAKAHGGDRVVLAESARPWAG